MKKKILTIALAALLVLTMIGSATMAYLTDTDKADNVFTVGNVNIVLTETKWEAGDAEANDVYPGEALPKNPVVANVSDDGNTISANPCFVRVKVEGLNCLGENNMITYETNYVTGALGENWEYNEDDGYFYYKKVLGGAYQVNNEDMDYKTTELFQQIRIPTTVTNGFTGKYDVKVSAEAVQAQGAKPSWSAVKAMTTVEEIAAWFATCMPAAPVAGN